MKKKTRLSDRKQSASYTNCLLASSFVPDSDEMTYYDFIVKKQHLFLRNVYDDDVLKSSKQIKDLKTYYESFNKVVHCAIFSDKYYSIDSDIFDIDHDCMIRDVDELYDVIHKTKIKTSRFTKKVI